LDLYSSFHKLSMLNDLVIPRPTRERFKRDTTERRFASRLPEPQDEEKVFRFERVQFTQSRAGTPVDYVSLSDGEHQLAQLLGTLCMLAFGGVLFLLDEPESHFNPQWRVKIISRILALPTRGGTRDGKSSHHLTVEQECLLTTHAPFVPSDLPRERVLIFTKEDGKVSVARPDVETYGTTFDTILEECFRVRPPISRVPLTEIAALKKSNDVDALEAAMERLGPSVEKAFLADHLRQVAKTGKA
jgi:restriction system-associated AAA family ATPase